MCVGVCVQVHVSVWGGVGGLAHADHFLPLLNELVRKLPCLTGLLFEEGHDHVMNLTCRAAALKILQEHSGCMRVCVRACVCVCVHVCVCVVGVRRKK